VLPRAENANLSADAVLQRVRQLRNVVLEMIVVLRAVKPIRPPDRALMPTPVVNFQLV